MKIFVAGATGAVGRPLVAALIAAGHSVVGLTRTAGKAEFIKRMAAEPVIADGLDAAKGWIRDSIELQRQLVEKAGRREPIPYVPQVDYGDDVWEKVKEVGTERIAHITTITTKAERNAATDEATAAK